MTPINRSTDGANDPYDHLNTHSTGHKYMTVSRQV